MGGEVTESVWCVFCETEGTTKYFKGETPTEVCPTDGGHTVTNDSLAIVKVDSAHVLKGEDGKIYELYIDNAGNEQTREIL